MDSITVLVVTNPIPSHPDTAMIEQTVASIRERLPTSEIVILCDGLSMEKMDRRVDYGEYIRRLLWKCNNEWENVTPIVFGEHQHQTNMTRRALESVDTPLILFVEHDTPLTGEIPFDKLAAVVEAGYANLIRLHHEAQVHPEHEYLMLDKRPKSILGVPLLRTRQWSQRPHLASTAFYRDIMKYWGGEPRFIEHVMYGVVVDGGWENFRLHIYAPKGTLVRSLHVDGRRLGAEHYDTNTS